MKKLTKIAVAAAMAAFVALCLVACGGGSSSAGGSATASSGGNTGAYEPIYVVKSMTLYSSTVSNGEVTETKATGWYDYEYDKQGNRTQWTAKSLNPNTGETATQTQSWSDFDEYGYAGKFVGFDGQTTTSEWLIEDGHAVSASSSAGSSYEFTYYDDGKLKSQVIDYGARKVSIEYGKDGLPEHQVIEGENAQTVDYAWTLDNQGRIESRTTTTTMSNGETHVSENTFEYDDNGNISTVYRDGALSAEIEYQKIDNPSTNAWVTSWIPQF